jgi:hypothetical protein
MAAGPDLPWLRRKCQPRLARQIDPGSSIYLERLTKTSGEGLVNCLRFPQIGEAIFASASGTRIVKIPKLELCYSPPTGKSGVVLNKPSV